MHLLPLRRTVWGEFKLIGKEFQNYCMRSVDATYWIFKFILIHMIDSRANDHMLLPCDILHGLTVSNACHVLEPCKFSTLFLCLWSVVPQESLHFEHIPNFLFASRKLVMIMLQQLPRKPTRRGALWRWDLLFLLVVQFLNTFHAIVVSNDSSPNLIKCL